MKAPVSTSSNAVLCTLSRRRVLGLGLGLAAALPTVALTGCGEESAVPSAGSGAAAGASAGRKMHIGVVQLVKHSALDDAVQGFQDELAKLGWDASKVELDLQNAHADTATLQAIANRFVSAKVDLIYAVSTPALQAVARATRTIPIVATAVTDFEGARVVKTNEKPGGNVTGFSNIGPVDKQLELLLKIVGKPEAIGTIYNAGEDNSLNQVERFKKALEGRGIELRETTVTNVNDITQAVASLRGKVQAIWVPTDNVVASASPLLAKLALEAKIPVVAGDLSFVLGGCLATVTVSHYTLGAMSAKRAVEILEGRAKPAELPIGRDESPTIVVNEDALKAYGLTLPEDVARVANMTKTKAD